MPIEIRITPKGTNKTGYYRECENVKCKKLVPCPYVKCQKCRTDFCVNDKPIICFDPKDVVIIKE